MKTLSVVFALLIVSCTCNEQRKIDPEEDAGPIEEEDAQVTDVETIDVHESVNGCPSEMVRVSGKYCTRLEHVCADYQDPPGSIVRRCAKYVPMSKCVSGNEKSLDFCIDKLELTVTTDYMPISDVTWHEARTLCEVQGKRLCSTEEWTLSCEGNERYPYPYGYERSSSKCNIDKIEILKDGKMIDLRQKVTDNPECKSPFGVQNMTGNVDEWTADMKRAAPFRSFLQGGWWGPLRNRCRAITGGHDEYFHEIQTGIRCCKESEK